MPSVSERLLRHVGLGLALGATTLGHAGCATTFVAPPTPSRPVATDDVLRAGASRVDITPAPGLAMFGHGPEGRVARGILLRLRCTAVALSRGSEAMVLVPCDLAAPSLLLQRRVAIEVQRRHPEVPLGADRIVVSAIHTHAGPAHFFGAGNYAGPLSTRGEQGTSEEVVSFLAEKIADAVGAAWASRQPAALGWGFESVTGMTKNRSMEAFALNAPRGPAGVDGDTTAQFVAGALRAVRPAEAAVDATLSVLRIDAVEPAAPLAAIAYFGSHPTAVPNTNDLYHSDVFGYATRAVFEGDDDPACGGKCPAIAVVNGLSGDVSPAVDEQGPREARRWGHDLGGKIRAAWKQAATSLDAKAHIQLAYREVDLVSAPVASLDEVAPRGSGRAGATAPLPPWVTPCACAAPRAERICGEPPPRPHDRSECVGKPASDGKCAAERAMCACTCDHANVGAAASGGAEDGPTAFRFIDGFREGSRIERDACQAPKIEIAGLGACEDQYPHHVPLWILRLGGGLVVTFPAEVTVTAGSRTLARVRKELALRALDADVPKLHVVPATLVGDWLQYVATEEEYPAQQYEGASTMWGPASAKFFERQVSCLAGWLAGGAKKSDPLDVTCRLGQSAPFVMRDVVFEVPSVTLEPRAAGCASDRAAALEPAPGTAPAGPSATRSAVSLAARDGELGFQATYFPPSGCGSERHVPRASIVEVASRRVVDDDEGDAFELRAFPKGVGGRVGPTGLLITRPGWLVSWFPGPRWRARHCGRAEKASVMLRVSLARAPRDGLEAARGGGLEAIIVESAPFSPCD